MRKLIMLTVITTLFTACPGSNTSNNNSNNSQNNKFNFEKFYADFQAKKAAWEELGIEHYKYTVRQSVRPEIWEFWLTVVVYPDEREPEIIEVNGRPITSEWVVERRERLDELFIELWHLGYIPLTINQLYLNLESSMHGSNPV
jgi:hypothetical protein